MNTRKVILSALAPAVVSVTLLNAQLTRASDSDSATLLAGETTQFCGAGGGVNRYWLDGFNDVLPLGSYSPTGLTGGETVAVLEDETPFVCGTTQSGLTISGFSANPGSSWLISVTCNGVTNTGSGGSYGYSSGTAAWSWSQVFGFHSKKGSNISCTIVHN